MSQDKAKANKKTILDELKQTIISEPKPGALDDILLILMVVIIQLPFYLLIGVRSGLQNGEIGTSINRSLGYMLIADIGLILIFWIGIGIMKLIEKILKEEIFLTAGISLLYISLIQGGLWLSNKIRHSKQPKYFYVHERAEKRRVIDIFWRSLWLSFLSVIFPFQIITILKPRLADLSITDGTILGFIIWAVIMAYLFIAFDLLERTDLRYFDEDDVIMQRFSGIIQSYINIFIGVIIGWFIITNINRFNIDYLLVGIAFLTTELMLVIQVLQNYEMEIDKIVNWIRQGFERTSLAELNE